MFLTIQATMRTGKVACRTLATRGRSGVLLAVGLALLGGVVAASAGVEVHTLGGGRLNVSGPDYGFVDGNTLQLSQFHTPSGVAVDSSGLVYLADRDNGSIRRLDLANNRSTTVLSGLKQPVAVAVAGPNDIYFLTQGDGRLGRMDRFGNVQIIASGLSSPTALTLDAATNIYVTELRGTVVRLRPGESTASVVATGFNQPGGIVALDNGLLAVSDTGNHQIRTINPVDGRVLLKIGDGEAGFRDGAAPVARFHEPRHLAKTPSGQIVLADRLNHRVRLIDSSGTVSTVYGVDPSAWEGPECATCSPMILPGWYDGTVEFAESRQPVGVAVSSVGTLYATEDHYHLVREITGAFVVGGGNGGSETVVLPPTISPSSGFYPLGQVITVVNPNSNPFLPVGIYYTTDGSTPGTNSFKLELTGNSGTIFWASPDRDLTSLRLKAFIGSDSSVETSGTPAGVNEIGVPRDVVAGMGSTVVLPVIVNLRTNDPLKSLQFRVEVTPATPGAPLIPQTFDAMNVSTDDFIRVATSDKDGGPVGSTNRTVFNVGGYLLGDTRGLAITMIGTNANFSVRNFAVVAMVSVPIPVGAKTGDRYQIEVVKPSGTSDGIQSPVSISPMTARSITVANVGYEVGDTARAVWYNADTPGQSFGDGALDNADVNNAFSASLGVRVPPQFSDLYDAMDAFPEDSEGTAGGDGLIRFLDWQVILLRSLGLDTNRWVRTWSDGGVRVAHKLNASENRGLRSTPASVMAGQPPGNIWYRQALLKADAVEEVRPGMVVNVPVHVVVAPGEKLGGLAFRASITGEGSAPQLSEPVQFLSGPTIPQSIQSRGQSPGEVLCGWAVVPSPAFNPVLQGTVLLGYLRVVIPTSASQGQVYAVHFENADGAPDLQTQYDIETLPASLWVESLAGRPAELISDEWKRHFFGSITSDAAHADADPDGDGSSNLTEYRAGTNPVDQGSSLHLQAPTWDPTGNGVVLRWLSSQGRLYTIEGSADLGGSWTTLATGVPGNGFTREFPLKDGGQSNRFYRLRLQP